MNNINLNTNEQEIETIDSGIPPEQESYINTETDVETAEILRNVKQTSPEEAVKSIERAEHLGMNPDNYVEMRETLEPEVIIQERTPAEVNPTLKKVMKTSATMSEAIQPEIGLIDKIGKHIDFIKYNFYEKRDLDNELLDLEEQDSQGLLDEDQKEYRESLYDYRDEKIQSFGLTENEQMVGSMFGIPGDMLEIMGKNKTLILGSTATGAALGAVGGVSAIPVAAIGFGAGVTAAMVTENLRKERFFTRGELRRMKDENGVPLNLPINVVDNISLSVGVANGALELVGIGALSGSLKKLFFKEGSTKIAKKGAMAIVKSPLLKSAFDLFGHTVKNAIAESGEEVVQEINSIVAEEYAKGYKDEVGLANTMLKVSKMVVTDPETMKRLGRTAVIAAGGGGMTIAATGAPAVPQLKKAYEQRNIAIEKYKQEITAEAIQSLETQNAFNELSAKVNHTNLSKMSPALTYQIVGEMMHEAGVVDRIFISKTDIDTIAETDPELAKRLKELDVTESTEADSDAPIGVVPHQFLPLVQDFPSVTEYARNNPEAPNPLESRIFFETVKEAEAQRQELYQSLGVDEELSPEQIETSKGIDKTIEDSIKATGEQGYLESPTFTPNIEGGIPDKQLESFNKAQLEARRNVAKQINEEFERSEQRIRTKLTKQNEKNIKQNKIKELSEDLKLVENFKYIKNWPVEGHKKQGFSVYAIDPKTLPGDLREAYLSDPTLKKRRVFVEGGKSLAETASLLGYEDSLEMLKKLANAPTKEEIRNEIKKESKEFKKLLTELQLLDSEKRRNEVFDNLSNAHLKEAKFMWEQKRPAAKQGVKIIALPFPQIAELQYTAKKVIAKTKVGELNVKQFNAGEKAAQRKAVTEYLNQRVLQASVAKEKAILNNELTREALRVKAKIADAKQIVKRMTSKKSLKLFEKSGLTKEITGILSVFDLTDKVSKKKKTEQEMHLDFAKRLDEQGESVTIPDSLSGITQRGSDLTTEQFLRITERLQTLEHQAKQKNKLLRKQEKQEKLNKIQTVEAIVEPAVLNLQEHPTYDEKRFDKVTNINSKTQSQRNSEGFNIASAMLTNFKNIVTELDQENVLGMHHEILTNRMNTSENYKRSKNFLLAKHFKKIAKDYGEKNFDKAFNEFIEIEEFEGIQHLGYGTMSKSDLWVLFAYLGDPNGRERIQNYINPKTKVRFDPDTMLKVLEKHLTEADVKVAQNLVNIFKSFEEDSKQLHYRTTGVMPDMIKGVPITFKGKAMSEAIVLEGGYVPNNYLNLSPDEKATRFLEGMGKIENGMFGGKQDNKLYGALRAMEQTDQGRFIDRFGSSKPLDTNFGNLLRSYEETIHDLAYRETGSDILKLLKNPVYQKSIIATVGESKYKTLINAAVETVGTDVDVDILSPLNEEIKGVAQIQRRLERAFSVGVLGFNLKSVMMQPLSIGAAVLRMGPIGNKYIAQSMGRIVTDPLNYNDFFTRAAEINPDILFGRDGIDDTVLASTFEVISTSRREGKTLSLYRNVNDKVAEFSMLGLRHLDLHIKVAITMASYAQFMDGNVEGFSTTKLGKMTEAQKETKAREYAKSIADLALTTSATIDKSAVEKIEMMRIFTRFYTDRRAQLNTAFSQGRKIRNEIIKGKKALQEKDSEIPMASFKKITKELSSTMVVYTLVKMYTDSLYGEDTPVTELKDINSVGDFGKYLIDTGKYALTSPIEGIVGSSPIGGDIAYALGSNRANKKFGLPITQVFTEFTMGASAAWNLIQFKSLSKKQKQGLFFTGTLASSVFFNTGGFPINGPKKAAKTLGLDDIYEDATEGVENFISRLYKDLYKTIDKYVEDNKNKPSEQKTIEGLKDIQQELTPPEDTPAEIPEDSLEVLKTNDWDDLDPDTGAAGVYQFTEEIWDEISEANPDIGLTDNGRVSKDTTEQEKAMKWELEQNAGELKTYRLPVNNSNLYGAHRFGLDDYAMIALSKGDEKLSDIVSDMTLFKGFTTVKQVKTYISKQIIKKKG